MLRPRREHAASRTVTAFEDPWAADADLRGDTWQLPNDLAHLDTNGVDLHDERLKRIDLPVTLLLPRNNVRMNTAASLRFVNDPRREDSVNESRLDVP